jgi:DHA1 family multidrug resistance protein-like MFS transporter
VLNGGILLLAALLLWAKGKNVFPVSARKNVTDQDIHSVG